MGGEQSHSWWVVEPPGTTAPSHLAPLQRHCAHALGGIYNPHKFSPHRRQPESVATCFISAKRALPYVFNKSREFSPLAVMFGFNQIFK